MLGLDQVYEWTDEVIKSLEKEPEDENLLIESIKTLNREHKTKSDSKKWADSDDVMAGSLRKRQ